MVPVLLMFIFWYFSPASFVTKKQIPSGSNFCLASSPLVFYRLRIYSEGSVDVSELTGNVVIESKGNSKIVLSDLNSSVGDKNFRSFAVNERILSNFNLDLKDFSVSFTDDRIRVYLVRYTPSAPTQAFFFFLTSSDSVESKGRRIF